MYFVVFMNTAEVVDLEIVFYRVDFDIVDSRHLVQLVGWCVLPDSDRGSSHASLSLRAGLLPGCGLFISGRFRRDFTSIDDSMVVLHNTLFGNPLATVSLYWSDFVRYPC